MDEQSRKFAVGVVRFQLAHLISNNCGRCHVARSLVFGWTLILAAQQQWAVFAGSRFLVGGPHTWQSATPGGSMCATHKHFLDSHAGRHSKGVTLKSMFPLLKQNLPPDILLLRLEPVLWRKAHHAIAVYPCHRLESCILLGTPLWHCWRGGCMYQEASALRLLYRNL